MTLPNNDDAELTVTTSSANEPPGLAGFHRERQQVQTLGMAMPNLTPEYLAQDQRLSASVAIAATTCISFSVVCVRVYSRVHIVKKFGPDDWLICIAMVLNIAMMSVSFKILDNGAGQHIYALVSEPVKLVRLYKFLVAGQLIYMIALWVCRISGLAFYQRLNSAPRFVLYLRIAFAFVTAVFICQLLLIALQCIPLAGLWDTTIKAKCLTSKTVFITTASMTIVCDALILFLPMNIIFNLKTNVKRKLGLAFVLCFGIFALITSIFRIVAMIPAVNEADATWYFSVVMIWSDTEISSAIIALSLPALKSLFTTYLKNNSTNHSSTNPSRDVNLRTIGSGGGPIYQGPRFQPAEANVTSGDNESEEELFPPHDLEIQVKKAYHVNVRSMDECSEHWKSSV